MANIKDLELNSAIMGAKSKKVPCDKCGKKCFFSDLKKSGLGDQRYCKKCYYEFY